MQMRELIDEQEKEVERAVLKRGKYEFEDDYQHLEVPEAKWIKMTAQQRKRHLQKVATTCLMNYIRVHLLSPLPVVALCRFHLVM